MRCYTMREHNSQGVTCSSWDGINGSKGTPCTDCPYHPLGDSNTPCEDRVLLLGVWANDPEVQLAFVFKGDNLPSGEALQRFLLGVPREIYTVGLTISHSGDTTKVLPTIGKTGTALALAKKLWSSINFIENRG